MVWLKIDTVPINERVWLGAPGRLALGIVTRKGRKNIKTQYWSLEGPTPYEGDFELDFIPTVWRPIPEAPA